MSALEVSSFYLWQLRQPDDDYQFSLRRASTSCDATFEKLRRSDDGRKASRMTHDSCFSRPAKVALQ